MKTIPGYGGRYSATKNGEIWSNRFNKRVNTSKNSRGYKCTRLYINGATHRVEVQNLVAATYLPNPHARQQVIHKDGDKTNNHISNLQWMDAEMRDVKGYEGIYAITTDGRVWSYRLGHFMKPYTAGGGYRYIGLQRGRHIKQAVVHRLVAEAFIDNPLNKKEVNHIDGNKTNNDVSNLEWVTRSENMIHMFGLKKALSTTN